VVVVREGILAPPRWMRLDWFGERSGTVVIHGLQARAGGRLLLNLETKEVTHMSRSRRRSSWCGRVTSMRLTFFLSPQRS
jgi:hypothetical protein